MKIEIIYKSLSRLLEILLKFQKEQTTKLEAFQTILFETLINQKIIFMILIKLWNILALEYISQV